MTMSDNRIPGVGEQHRQPDPRGVLVFRGLTEGLQASEDATLAADNDRAFNGPAFLQVFTFTRPATAAERLLLQHLGYGPLPADLATRVSYHTPGVRRRTWPAIGIN